MKKDLGKDSILQLVFSLAIPAMIAQLVNVLYSIVDRMFVGQIPEIGNQALAAVGVCGPIVTLLSSFGTLIGIGGSIFMSIKMGQKKMDDAKQILYTSFTMLVCVSIILTILFLFLRKPMIYWFGGSDALYPYANTYLTIYTAGTFFALMAIGMNYFITCQGFASIAMFSVIIGAITNIVLDAIFIRVLHMQIAGAAIATVIAQIMSSLFVVGFLISKYSHVQLKKNIFQTDFAKTILKLGFSPFIIIASDSIIIILMNTILQKAGGSGYGDVLISAATIAQSCFLLITGPLLGITSGTQTIISYNFGAKNRKRIEKAFKTIITLALCFCTFMFIIIMLFSASFVSMFTKDPTTTPIAIKAIRIFILGIIPMAIQYALVDGITALSNVKISLALSMTRKTIYIFSLVVLPIVFTAESIFFAQPIADILAASITSLVFLKTYPEFMRNNGMQEIQTS